MKNKLLMIICCLSFSLMASAQASGGQIRRPVKKQSTSRQRVDNRNSSTTSNVNNNNSVVSHDNNEQPKWTSSREDNNKANDSKEQIVMPMYPGGSSALFQYLSQNVHYPEKCVKNGIQGRVVIGIIIGTDGYIKDTWVVNSVDPDLDKEALRVVKNMPKWIPANDNGNPIRIKYTIPITFRL